MINKLKDLLLFSTILIFTIQCKKSNVKSLPPNTSTRIANLQESILNSNGNDVMVIAHRGDWRYAPENSLLAINKAIEIGVDIVEIDVRLTKDSIPVLMHDSAIDRTTTGKGKINEWILDSLQTLFLKNGLGHPTKYKIPTLKEAMETAKGKVLINLDKCYKYI